MFGLAERQLVPEILDALSPDDPRAKRSRADLRRINGLMGNARIIASLVNRHAEPRPGARFVEIGAGDGQQTLRVARRLAPQWPDAKLLLLDINPSVASDTQRAIEALGWSVEIVAADVFDWSGGDRASHDVAWVNLVLHHFERKDLERLMAALAARARVVVAAETRRTVPSLLAAWATALIGANDVTRHDAPASVRAGFRGRELAAAWPGPTVFEGLRPPFTHAFVGTA